ncbi:MAG: hypothetical protein IPJ85_10235 [Flavobacteriales bacterium]|nr:hypothetical protein [Flavobacteriales bacterium]
MNIASILNDLAHAAALKEAEEAMRIARETGAQYILVAAYAYAGKASLKDSRRMPKRCARMRRGAPWRNGSTTGATRPELTLMAVSVRHPEQAVRRIAQLLWVPPSKWRAR